MKQRWSNKLIVYVLLLGSALVFIIPLIWMVLTALKPIDQAMSSQPTWLPYRYSIETEERPIEVRLGHLVDRPGVWALEPGAARPEFIAGSADKHWRVLQDVPASAEEPWRVVYVEDGGEALIVPAAAIHEAVSPRWGNFATAIEEMGYFPQYLRNTLMLCLLTVIGTVCSSALVAYGFSRVEWPGRDKVFVLVLATMMIPFPVLMVPLYGLFRNLGWIGTLRPLWVPYFFATAFNVFLLRQFFMTIPRELSEAARIDGCSEFRTFFSIILPLAKPALIVVGLFQFLYTWNDFLAPLIYLTNQEDFTLALGLQFFQSQQGGTQFHLLMAASTLIVLPVVLLFFVAQRAFIEGVSMTGLKG